MRITDDGNLISTRYRVAQGAVDTKIGGAAPYPYLTDSVLRQKPGKIGLTETVSIAFINTGIAFYTG